MGHICVICDVRGACFLYSATHVYLTGCVKRHLKSELKHKPCLVSMPPACMPTYDDRKNFFTIILFHVYSLVCEIWVLQLLHWYRLLCVCGLHLSVVLKCPSVTASIGTSLWFHLFFYPRQSYVHIRILCAPMNTVWRMQKVTLVVQFRQMGSKCVCLLQTEAPGRFTACFLWKFLWLCGVIIVISSA